MPLDVAWSTADADAVRRIETAQGVVAERFAFCPALPLAEFEKTAEALRPAGYRPTRLRPYAVAASGPLANAADANAAKPTSEPLVATVWVRDGRSWRFAHDVAPDALSAKDASLQKESFRLVDIAVYLVGGKARYALLWVRGEGQEEATLHAGPADARYRAAWRGLFERDFRPATSQVLALPDGTALYNSVWRKPAPDGSAGWELSEREAADALALDAELPIDVGLWLSDEPRKKIVKGALRWLAGPPFAALTLWGIERDTPHPDRQYATTYQADGTRETVAVSALDPAAHLARCRELVAQGYRPAALSAVSGLVTSLWHRPVVAEADKEALAKRQAAAGVALLRLEQFDDVWPLLKHSDDDRVRSYLLERLSPLGAAPGALVRRLAEEPEVSIRRALLLALGEFDDPQLPTAEREALLPRLFALYRSDPDAGVHGSAAWLLRTWGQRAKLKEIDKELASGVAFAPRGDARRWFVNGQGQTMVLIPGPSEFLMGSPRTEAEREGGPENRTEQRHKKRIGGNYALATAESVQAGVQTQGRRQGRRQPVGSGRRRRTRQGRRL